MAKNPLEKFRWAHIVQREALFFRAKRFPSNIDVAAMAEVLPNFRRRGCSGFPSGSLLIHTKLCPAEPVARAVSREFSRFETPDRVPKPGRRRAVLNRWLDYGADQWRKRCSDA